jgi:hypothetical protein
VGERFRHAARVSADFASCQFIFVHIVGRPGIQPLHVF